MKNSSSKKAKIPLSVCIISLNEESCIERCLKSVAWADEIIVVDSGSKDKTESIVRKYTNEFHFNKWPGYGQQRKKAESLAKHNWILTIDCDEELTPELSSSLQKKLESNSLKNNTVYFINRLTRFQNKWIKHSGWHPDWIARVYNKQQTSYDLSSVHEKVVTTGNKTEKLKGLILHYNEDSWEEYKAQLKKYAQISADDKRALRKRAGTPGLIFRSTFAFVRHYILKLGFLDGKPGLMIAKAQVRYTWDKYRL